MTLKVQKSLDFFKFPNVHEQKISPGSRGKKKNLFVITRKKKHLVYESEIL